MASDRSLYEKLKESILNGAFSEGVPLVESVIAENFKVSRTPVREALARLEQDGLLERGDRGILAVPTRRPEDILDLYETRSVLEVEAGQVAAERRTSFDMSRLWHLSEAYEATGSHDPDVLASRNRDFHRGIWLASHNKSLLDLLDRLNLHLMRYPIPTLTYPGRWEESVTEHRALVDAIYRRDSAAAGAAARQHFTSARDIRLSLMLRPTDTPAP